MALKEGVTHGEVVDFVPSEITMIIAGVCDRTTIL
jgi:hypothetical protein